MQKNKIMSLFILFLVSFNLLKVNAATETTINISPVVQIISYYDIYGKYPMMMGWGSASIITKDGVIISNDHVVDDGKGALASAFSICVTKKTSDKPACDYTASLISRDDKLDISILRIDQIDIYGNKVDYTKFKTIDIDYDYEPQNQDETIAIGYPWVGADTISETKGIVSGVSTYNGYKYIKTDTLIAGGNSGGAFIRNGKLIGIPTFGIGGGIDSSMGYALSIKEAYDFIESNKIKQAVKNPITSMIDFNSYRKNIEDINSSLFLKDDIFDIKLLPDYQVSNYIKNTTLNIELKKQKDTGVSYLGLYIEKVPTLDTDKKLFYYFEKNGFYSKSWQKLLKKNISGIDFYYPVDKTDLSAGDSNWGNSYKAYVNNYIISIDLQAPLYDEKRNKEVKKEIDNVLNSIKIDTKNLTKIQTSFSTNEPKIDITNYTKSLQDTGRYRLYLGENLYEYFDIYLNELQEYNGKGKTAKEIYDVQLKDVDISEKSMINFKGLDGFINCSGYSSISSYYNYYNYYDSGYKQVDENGNSIDIDSCDIDIFFPLNKDLNRQSYISISLNTLKNNREKNLDSVISFITNNINVYTNLNKVSITNIFKNATGLKFSDINKQSTAYKKFLSLLIRYNMIENKEKFEGNTPITWGQYLDMYVKWIYNYNTNNDNCKNNDYLCKFSNYKLDINGKEISLDTIFKDLGVDNYNDYIDASKINVFTYGNNEFINNLMNYYSQEYMYEDQKNTFDKVLNYKLAGIDDIGNYTYSNLDNFENNIDEMKFVNSKTKIDDFFNKIYGNKKILLSDFYNDYSTLFYTQKTLVYYPNIKILKLIDKTSNDKISFSSKETKKEIEFDNLAKNYNCYDKKSFLDYTNCNKEYDKKYSELKTKYNELDNSGEYYFYPLSKADAIKNIFSQVDFGLFDNELAKKKDTQVEDNSGEDTTDIGN